MDETNIKHYNFIPFNFLCYMEKINDIKKRYCKYCNCKKDIIVYNFKYDMYLCRSCYKNYVEFYNIYGIEFDECDFCCYKKNWNLISRKNYKIEKHSHNNSRLCKMCYKKIINRRIHFSSKCNHYMCCDCYNKTYLNKIDNKYIINIYDCLDIKQ